MTMTIVLGALAFLLGVLMQELRRKRRARPWEAEHVVDRKVFRWEANSRRPVVVRTLDKLSNAHLANIYSWVIKHHQQYPRRVPRLIAREIAYRQHRRIFIPDYAEKTVPIPGYE